MLSESPIPKVEFELIKDASVSVIMFTVQGSHPIPELPVSRSNDGERYCMAANWQANSSHGSRDLDN